MYLYQSHLGGIYALDSDYEESIEDLFCETCGDYDFCLGEYFSAKKFLEHYADEIDAEDGHGGWAIEHVLEVLECFEDCPFKEEAIKIVVFNRYPDEIDEEDEEEEY